MVVFLSLGMRWGRYTVVGELSKTFGRRKIFKHAQNFFLGPTFANVSEQTLWNVCKTLCKRYEIVQFVRLSFRMRLTIVRKRLHSFALYIACYNRWADQLCAGGVGTPWRMLRGCVAGCNRPAWNRSVILQSLRGFLSVVGEPDRLGGLSRLLWERGAAARMTGPFPLDTCFFPLPRPLPVMFIHWFLWHKSMMTTFASVFIPHTEWRHDSVTRTPPSRRAIVTESFCALIHR